MLYPVTDDYQEIIMHSLAITGNPTVEQHTESFGNRVGTFTHPQPHSELVIDSRVEVVTHARPLPEALDSAEEQWNMLEKVQSQIPFIDFLRPEIIEALPEIQGVIQEVMTPGVSPLDAASKFSAYVYENFTYQKGITTVETTVDEIWKLKSGVCQDFAHVLLAFLRIVKIPARYVSGYICPNKNGMRGEGATHA